VMAQTKHEIQELLEKAGTGPRHRFGQNFMIDRNLVRVVAEAGEIARGDLVIEVGPGTGTLSEEILERGGEMVAVEIDRGLADLLRARFGERSDFRLIEGDALAGKHVLNEELAAIIVQEKGQGRAVKLVANLPYNIASPLIVDLLIAGVDLLAFTVQREVAERLRAAAGTEAYGALTVMAQLLGRVEMLRTLPPQAFWPPPRIESALVRIRREDRLGGLARPFGQFVLRMFSARRKTIRKALANAGFEGERLLEEAGIDPKLRPEDLSPQQLLGLFGRAGAG
jgi:16S rRNA (adenine1518-N6/adenine1519-N6)-dimethyltransferase